jgi:hypothetical protein
MANTVSPSLVAAIEKLALAGEQVGFTIEQMIDLLDAGLTVEALLDLIAWRLEGSPSGSPFINPDANRSVPRRCGIA